MTELVSLRFCRKCATDQIAVLSRNPEQLSSSWLSAANRRIGSGPLPVACIGFIEVYLENP